MDIRRFLIKSYYKIDEIIENGYRRYGNSCRSCRREEYEDERQLVISREIGKTKIRGTMMAVVVVIIGVIVGIFVAFALAQMTYIIILK